MTIPSAMYAAYGFVRDVLFPHHPDIMIEIKPFGADEWAQLGVHIPNPPPIPQEMRSCLATSCPYWPGKCVRETHILCLIPANLDLNTLASLNKQPGYPPAYLINGAQRSGSEAYWILMTKEPVVEGYLSQRIHQLALKKYQPPLLVEAAVAIIAAQRLKKLALFWENDTQCVERDRHGDQLAIGTNGASTFHVSADGRGTYKTAGVMRSQPLLRPE